MKQIVLYVWYARYAEKKRVAKNVDETGVSFQISLQTDNERKM